MSTGREIRLTEAEDGWWVARDVEAEVTSQGETREEALENLDEAVALAAGEISPDPIKDEAAFLRDIGLDPDEVQPDSKELPEFMQ